MDSVLRVCGFQFVGEVRCGRFDVGEILCLKGGTE